MTSHLDEPPENDLATQAIQSIASENLNLGHIVFVFLNKFVDRKTLFLNVFLTFPKKDLEKEFQFNFE